MLRRLIFYCIVKARSLINDLLLQHNSSFCKVSFAVKSNLFGSQIEDMAILKKRGDILSELLPIEIFRVENHIAPQYFDLLFCSRPDSNSGNFFPLRINRLCRNHCLLGGKHQGIADRKIDTLCGALECNHRE